MDTAHLTADGLDTGDLGLAAKSPSRAILVVGTSAADANWIRTARTVPDGYDVVHLPDPITAAERVRHGDVGCVVLSLGRWDEAGLEKVTRLSAADPDVPILVLVDNEDDDRALEAIRSGAQDVIARIRLRNGDRLRASIRFAVERQRASARRKESEVRYRTAFENAPIGMAVLDLAGHFKQANQAMSDLLGHTIDELIGRSIGEFLLGEDLQETLGGRRLAEAIGAGGVRAEMRYVRADGRVMWARLRASLIPDLRGNPHQVVVQLEDVTAMRRAQGQLEELLESKDRGLRHARALATCSRVLLESQDLSHIDDALQELLVATEASSIFIEQNIEDPELGLCSSLIHEVTRGDVIVDPERWAKVPWSRMPDSHARLSLGEPFELRVAELGPVEASTYAGTQIASELDVPIFVGGHWAGLIGLADRRPERRWDEDELRLMRTAAEMIGSFWERREAREALEEMIRSKDEFVASVSHELRTPLTTVVGLALELRDRRHDFAMPEQQEFVDLMADQSIEVANIVEDLLVAARTEIGRVAIVAQFTDLASELEAVIAGLPRTARRPIRVDGDGAVVWADPTRTRQILRNLLTNAARYGGDSIRVEMVPNGTTASIRVIDNGDGVPTEQADRVFEPYERAHHAHGQPSSVGLGLTVSRELARLMDGDLFYRREHGQTVFELILPTTTPGD